MQYRVTVANRTGETITLRRVQIQSVTDIAAYVIAPTASPFEVAIPPNEFRAVELWAPAQLTGTSVGGANSPVSLRLMLQFDSPAGAFQETVIRQAHAASTSGGD